MDNRNCFNRMRFLSTNWAVHYGLVLFSPLHSNWKIQQWLCDFKLMLSTGPTLVVENNFKRFNLNRTWNPKMVSQSPIQTKSVCVSRRFDPTFWSGCLPNNLFGISAIRFVWYKMLKTSESLTVRLRPCLQPGCDVCNADSASLSLHHTHMFSFLETKTEHSKFEQSGGISRKWTFFGDRWINSPWIRIFR